MRTLPPHSVEPVPSRQQQLLKLRERIERGEYEVDPGPVADAIVSRLLTALATAPERRGRRAAGGEPLAPDEDGYAARAAGSSSLRSTSSLR
jgi:hypothetical protein